MKLSRVSVLVVSSVLVLSTALFSSESQETPQELPKTVAVAAFKNGLAFVVRQGVVHLQSGIGSITPIPNATLGTLWLAPANPAHHSMRSSPTATTSPRSTISSRSKKFCSQMRERPSQLPTITRTTPAQSSVCAIPIQIPQTPRRLRIPNSPQTSPSSRRPQSLNTCSCASTKI